VDITEALLEMHYHRAIIEAFESVFGAKFLRLLKPSPRREAWVGFDQGWLQTALPTDELYDELRGVVDSRAGHTTAFYLGYFLQFKVVERVSRSNGRMNVPAPYYRSRLSLSPNKTTRLSQHETLLRLSDVPQASVNYVCPFLFDLDDLYAPADLSTLQIVDVRSSPRGWATNESHFIVFGSAGDPSPQWHSEPTGGKGASLSEWLSSEQAPKPLRGPVVLRLIEAVSATLVEASQRRRYRPFSRDSATVLPESFALASFRIPGASA